MANESKRQYGTAADRTEISDCLLRLARGQDRKDWDIIRAAYHPGAIDDHGYFTGDVEGFIAWSKERHTNIEMQLHHLTNILIEFAGESEALAETYFMAQQRVKDASNDPRLKMMSASSSASGPLVFTSFGRYVDHFLKRDGSWKIQHRTVVFERSFGHVDSTAVTFPETNIQGRRDHDDASYVWRKRLNLPPG
jgi:hypothetical protein